MLRIVMFEPTRQLSHHRLRIRPMGQIGIVALEGSNETLRHPVALRAAHPRRHRIQSQLLSERARLRRRVTAAVIGQPFHIPGSFAVGSEALLKIESEVADV